VVFPKAKPYNHNLSIITTLKLSNISTSQQFNNSAIQPSTLKSELNPGQFLYAFSFMLSA